MSQGRNNTDPPDKELVERARAGSPEAWAQLIARHYGPVLHYLRGRGADEAEDLAQDVFLYALEHLDEVRQPERLRAWLYTVARHRQGMARRHDRRAATVALDQVAEPPDPATQPPSPTAERVRALLDELPPEQGRVLDLHLLQGVPLGETARRLALSVATTRARLTAARKRFRILYARGHGPGRGQGDADDPDAR